MDFKTIKKLLDLISGSDVNEVEIEEGEFKIRVKKQPDIHQTAGWSGSTTQAGRQVEWQAQAPPDQTAAPANEPSAPQDKSESGEKDGLITIRSPIVGTFYRSPSPDSDPFVQVGDSINKGDVLCIIEAMKIMNEIESEYTGKISGILVENAQPVEYDQPLFQVEPS